MESLELENYYKFNSFQTKLTQELKDSLHREIWLELIEYIDSVQFIKNLIALEEIRGYAKDQPKETEFYNDGRIYVNITKPHILEDLDFFRERAIFFEKNGRYTNITPNPNPKSEYAEFWKEELRRWKYGLVRESDGEWIPGYLYFYWNYSPIWLVEKIEGRKQGERKRKFPKPWLGDYLFFHYIDEAQRNGKHGKNLKSRGVGVSFKCSSMSPRNMYVYPGAGNVNFHLANEKSYLQGDKGLYGKVLECLDHIAEHTPLPKMRLIDGKKEMVVQLGFTDEYGVRKGLLSSVHAISLKDNPDKARGARGVFCHYEEDGIFDNLEKAWNVNRPGFEDGGVAVGLMLALGCLTENNYIWTNNGDFKKISELNKKEGIIGFNQDINKISKEEITYWQPPQNKECVRIELNTGRFIECSYDHPILYSNQKLGNKIELPNVNGKRRRKFKKKVEFKEACEIKIGDQLAIAEEVPIFSNKKMWEPRLIGWLVGDGSYGFNKTPVLSNCESEINHYLHNNLEKEVITEKTYITKEGKIYEENRIKNICKELRHLKIYGQTKSKKTLPANIHSYSKETISEFIGGFYDADGHISGKGIYLSSGHKSILLEMMFLLQKLGIHGNINFIKPSSKNSKSKNGHYVLEIKDKSSVLNFQKNIKLIPKHKKEKLEKIHILFENNKTREPEHLKGLKFERVVKIENIGSQPVYNLTAGTTHTYLGNGIITHNTGGVEGASFIGSEKLFYSPDAYNVFGIPNVFDKNSDGSSLCGHFWGAYLNRNDCYNLENGEPDVIKALIEILQERFVIKYNSQDPNAITQKKAELPITPQEAIMRTEGTVFPVADLKEHLETIMVNRDNFLSEHYVGELIRDNQGKVIWKPDDSIYPIRSYDKDNQRKGAIEIFEMPKTNAEGEIPRGRYIFGIDPIDADTGTSLFSIIGLDTFTDRIVCEYTGRTRLAEESYEIALRLIEFYNGEANYENNLKGLFSYFDKKNALHRLSDTPQILRDMDYMKQTNLYGNRAKGSPANKEINKWARKLHADWMNTSIKGDDTGKLYLHTMRSIAHIEEAIKWNSDGNFDRISSAGMLFILREDRYKRTESLKETGGVRTKDLSTDTFFNKNYNKNRNAIDDSII